MEQSRPRTKEIVIIEDNRSNLRFVLDIIMTLFFWCYSFIVMIFILSASFGYSNSITRVLNSAFKTTNGQVRLLFLFGLILFIIFYILLSMNRIYNKKRFGSLTRRIYPSDVTNKDLNNLQLMNDENIKKLQTSDYIVYDKNPIVSLEEEKES
jgi:poly-beta-1,6-N-acetyl-D-glucosamine biosynthesis protein PgaD